MKTALYLLILCVPTFAQLKVDYDKFKDQTTVSFSDGNINRSKDSQARVQAVKMIAWRRGGDHFIQFSVLYAREWKFIRNHALTFLVDGERIALATQWDGNVSRNYETVIAPINRDDLSRLANGKQVEMQLGNFEAEISEKQKKGLRELVEYQVK